MKPFRARIGFRRSPTSEVITDWTFLMWSFFFSSRRRHTRFDCDWSSDVCSSDLLEGADGDIFANRLERKPLPVRTHNNNKMIKTEDTNELEAGTRRPRPARSVRARDGRR